MKNIVLLSQNTELVQCVESVVKSLKYNLCIIYKEETGFCISAIDIIILDYNLLKEEISRWCTHIRKEDREVGIIVIGKDIKDEEVNLLFDIGMDDYINVNNLVGQLGARIKRLCSRVSQLRNHNKDGIIISGDIALDCHQRLVYKKGNPVKLTSIEYELIRYFMLNQHRAISRDEILDKIWGSTYIGDPKVVDVNVMRLRQKIEDSPKNPTYICKVWGYGYRWEGGKKEIPIFKA